MALPVSFMRKVETSKKSGTLNLRGEGLTSLPSEAYNRAQRDNFFDTVELVQLVLSHNEFESLPEDLGVLYELKLIDVSHNQLRHLPLDLFTISELRSIDISHNKFTELPDEMSRLSTLVSLSCASNQLTELPLEFGSMAYQLTKLEASDNALKTLPMALKNAYSLSLLNLEKNRIERFPGGIFRGTDALTELNLDNNQLTELPKELQHLTNLKILRVRHNHLTSVPDEISGCKSLLELYLGYNKIQTLTDSIGALRCLVILDLNTNEMKSFPGPSCREMQLQTLDLSNNNLSGLPGEVGLITTLRRLPLDGNPLRTIRRDLTMGPIGRLLESLRKKLPVEEDVNEAVPFSSGRVMITGDPFTQIKNLLQSYVTNKTPGELNLSRMNLKDVPSDIWIHIGYVNKLDLNENPLVEFDGRPMCDAIRLKTLLMQCCQLQNWPLPSQPDCLSSLVELDLSRNKQMPIPENAFVSCAETLSEINLNGVLSASSMPKGCLVSLKCIKSVSLSMTQLREFPVELLEVPSLCYVDISQNGIEILPEDITRLENLEYLDISNNSISSLPLRLGFMDPVLKTLKLEGNILKTIRRSILNKGTGPLLEYLRERAPAQ